MFIFVFDFFQIDEAVVRTMSEEQLQKFGVEKNGDRLAILAFIIKINKNYYYYLWRRKTQILNLIKSKIGYLRNRGKPSQGRKML